MLAEYIWIDGGRPTARVRSKTRVLPDGAGSGVFSDVAIVFY